MTGALANSLMGVAIITGSGRLIGSESVRFFAEQGLNAIGLTCGLASSARKRRRPRHPSASWMKSMAFAGSGLDICDAEGISTPSAPLGVI